MIFIQIQRHLLSRSKKAIPGGRYRCSIQ